MTDDQREPIHPLVRAMFMLQTSVAFLLGRLGLGPWQPGDDVDERICLWAFKSRFSWCCGASLERHEGQGTEEFCAQCKRYMGHFHRRPSHE